MAGDGSPFPLLVGRRGPEPDTMRPSTLGIRGPGFHDLSLLSRKSVRSVKRIPLMCGGDGCGFDANSTSDIVREVKGGEPDKTVAGSQFHQSVVDIDVEVRAGIRNIERVVVCEARTNPAVVASYRPEAPSRDGSMKGKLRFGFAKEANRHWRLLRDRQPEMVGSRLRHARRRKRGEGAGQMRGDALDQSQAGGRICNAKFTRKAENAPE